MIERTVDVAIVGSGAGGGTVAAGLAPLCAEGRRIVVLEKGPRLREEEFTGRELEMASALYESGGGVLTTDGAMTLAAGSAYGGSTVVYTGTSLIAPERVIERWGVPGLAFADVERRSHKFMVQNHVHLEDPDRVNENNRLFVQGCRALGFEARQFPINTRGCKGSGLCNLGCPNAAKQGTNRVQLPAAEARGVEVVTRCEVLRVEERALVARVRAPAPGAKGEPSPWAPGLYRIRAAAVVLAAGALRTPGLLARSGFGRGLPRLGRGFTCHPALILAGEHPRPIARTVGHPKHYYLDGFAESRGFLLETCSYFPFVTAKSLAGFGAQHEAMMRAFPRLQMILVLACDRAIDTNRVGCDRRGEPVVRYRFTGGVRRSLVAGAVAAARIMLAAGAERVHVPVADDPLVSASDRERLAVIEREADVRPGKTPISAAHLMGGCAMGRGPSDSVTDACGAVHGREGLFVADASLFPDSVEINPYLTIMALADRVAERVAECLPRLRRGI